MKKLILLLIAVVISASINAQLCEPISLKCEYLNEPLGIDVAAPRFSWMIKDGRTAAKQTAYKITVGTTHDNADMWNTEKVNSDNILTKYQGKQLQPFTKYYWTLTTWDADGYPSKKVSSSFETGMMCSTNWKGAWISDRYNIDKKEAPLFRRKFETNKTIKSARAYVAAAGLYELYINGEKIGNHRLDPTYTRFDRRNLYVTHDVTKNLKNGENAIGVILGNGWYNHQSSAVWDFHVAPWRNRPAFCIDLKITYTDGTSETVSSDKAWKSSLSPIIFNSIYTAEHYDARLEQPGWNNTGFDDQKWEGVIYRTAPSKNVVSQQLHPVRNVEEIKAKSVNKINDTIYVFDLGRNISGVSKITVKGEEGTVIHLEHSERLQTNGRVDMTNINVHYRPKDNSDPFQTDIFILGGKGEETFMPRFNYKGFQYIEVRTSKPLALDKTSLTGYFMHSDVPPTGQLKTSNPTINGIWYAANNSYLSNLFGYPTDCPQREKNGWTGDAHIAIETGLYNFDAITVYEKWLADHRDEQQPNGVLPSIIPTGGWGYEWGNGPDWTSTIAIIPWNIYLFYGDSQLLEQCYDNIKRYVDRISYTSKGNLTTWGLGDWVPVKSKTDVELTSSVYYFVDATILAKAAKLFGKDQDHKKYSELAENIRKAINDKYLDRSTGIYGKGVQTEMSSPLFWGVAPDDMREKITDNLVKRVNADNNKIDVGLLGTKSILNALSENGHPDLAYKMASAEVFPSWGWWIVNGATTLYENWPIDAKSDISMNHIMFGEVSAWFFKTLGGIKPDENNPGFKNVILRPAFVTGLNNSCVTHQSPYGLIVSEWNRTKKGVIYNVNIPANSTGELFLPKEVKIKSCKQLKTAKNETLNITALGSYVIPAGEFQIEFKKQDNIKK